MSIKLLVFGVTVALINTEISAQYNTYEVYEVYPPQTRHHNQYYQPQNTQQQYYQPQNTQQYYNRPQKTYPAYNQNPYQYYTQPPVQQQTDQVTVAEAEWVCTNPKTNDMMIIAVDDLGSRNSGPSNVHWHQVNPTNNQPNHVQPQPQPTFGNPTIAPVNPVYTQPPANPTTTEKYTTTEREPGPIWPSGNDVTTKKPVYTTTPRPLGPIWSGGDDNKNNNGNKGFTVDDTTTTQRPFYSNPFYDPTTHKPKPPTTTTPNPDEEGGIEIIMGK